MKRIGVFILLCLQINCTSQETKKINGLSLVASRNSLAQENVKEVLNLNANHATIMPFGFIGDLSAPEIMFNSERQWFGETKKGAKQYIQKLHENGIGVMLKPQIWIRRGEFTGNLKMNSEAEWNALESSYRKFILTYAELAEEEKIEIFCLGTELEEFVVNRPNFWLDLIHEVKKVFSGKLTYAANWDEYTKVTFWEELDYIGIDAYFPLSDAKSPTVEELKTGWHKWKGAIAKFSSDKKAPVLFTEFGYRSMDFTAKKPWLVDRHDENVNMEAQVNATKAIIEEFWAEEWFAGGYVWKWFIDHEQSGGSENNRFTPQNKPAEQTIRALYKMY
jgi:hypothetical protein